jgi:hypothetical protein
VIIFPGKYFLSVVLEVGYGRIKMFDSYGTHVIRNILVVVYSEAD